jgi:hypothetical protein
MSDNAMKDLRKLVNDLIRDRRPDRYTVGGVTDDEESETAWLNAIAVEVEPLIPDAEVRTLFARTLVNQEEGKATRRANAFLRDFARTGQLPMLWAEDGDWPVSVVSAHPDDPTKRIEERVALRAVTATDARLFANEERRRAAKDFASRNESCVGAEAAADEAERCGLSLIWDYFATLDGSEPRPT